MSKFADDIETIVYEHDLSYIDAIIHYCEINELEVEHVASAVKMNKQIKGRVELEAEEANMLKTKEARLPF